MHRPAFFTLFTGSPVMALQRAGGDHLDVLPAPVNAPILHPLWNGKQSPSSVHTPPSPANKAPLP